MKWNAPSARRDVGAEHPAARSCERNFGGTYGVSAGFANTPPIKGYGAVQIQF